MLRFEGISKSYGARQVLRGLRHSFSAGVHALRGPNGIGKSTLLRVLAGIDEPDGGAVWIAGIDLQADPAAAKARLAYAPDECPVYPFMTGRELLAFVAWAKACEVSAAVLLFDEPSNGLDADARALLIELLAAKGRVAAVLVSTHDQDFARALGAKLIEFEALALHAEQVV